MKPEGGHKHRTAVTIVSGINDVLQAWSDVDAAPDMRGVIGLHDVFASVVQPTVAEQKTIFESEPGVIVLSERRKGSICRRQYRTLRIPEFVVQQVHRRLSVR